MSDAEREALERLIETARRVLHGEPLDDDEEDE